MNRFLSILFFTAPLAIHAAPVSLYKLKGPDGCCINLIGNRGFELNSKDFKEHCAIFEDFYQDLHKQKDITFFMQGFEDEVLQSAAYLFTQDRTTSLHREIGNYSKTLQWQIINGSPLCINQNRAEILAECMGLIKERDPAFGDLVKKYLNLTADGIFHDVMDKIKYIYINSVAQNSELNDDPLLETPFEIEFKGNWHFLCDPFCEKIKENFGARLIDIEKAFRNCDSSLSLLEKDNKNNYNLLFDWFLQGCLINQIFSFFKYERGLKIDNFYLAYALIKITKDSTKSVFFLDDKAAVELKNELRNIGWTAEYEEFSQEQSKPLLPETVRTFLQNTL